MIRRISLIRRKSGMSPDEFWAHYSGPHAAIARQLPGLQRMVLSRVMATTGDHEWDAVGELWFASIEAVTRAFADPEMAALFAEDRPKFIGQMVVVLTEETEAWQPPAGALSSD